MEKRGARAAEALRDLDRHDAHRKELVDELSRDSRLLVHGANERSDFAIGELEDAVSEQPFVFGQQRQGGSRRLGSVCGHAMAPLSDYPITTVLIGDRS